MNSTLLKGGAIVILAAGIIGFVAFRSGYFDSDPVENLPEPEITLESSPHDSIEKEQDSIEVDESSDNPNPTPHVISHDEIEPMMMPSSKSAVMFDPKDFDTSPPRPIRMHSSKSAPVFLLDDLNNSNGTDDTVIIKKSNQNIRMGGSKSLQIFNPNDLKSKDTLKKN